MTTNKYITPEELIQKRNTIISEIKRCWSIITAGNVITNGTKPQFDLTKVYSEIKRLEMDLVKSKAAQAAINSGFSKLSDLPKNNSIVSIATLSQIKERIVKLALIPTKKKEGESVHFTRTFIENETKLLKLEQAKIEGELTKFNKAINFEM